jgi:PGF-CTERM protein
VTISANPAEIAADSNSTSKIDVVILWPEGTEHSGEPAENETVVMTVGAAFAWLTDIGNESNTGILIRVSTDENGTATALLSGNETGEVTVKADCLSGGWNLTKVTFLEPGTTVVSTTSGNGVEYERSETSPNETVTPTVNETETPAVNETATPTASPEASPEATPTPTPTTSTEETPEPKPSTPGFEASFVIAGMLSIAYLVLRRRKA